MPAIAGQVVILTVSEVDRSTDWYGLLGMEGTSRYVQPDEHVPLAHSAEPRSGSSCAWLPTAPSRGSFDAFRIGLDRLEFPVAQRNDLDAWAARLDELGIRHSGVKEPPYTANAMLTFCDPDNT